MVPPPQKPKVTLWEAAQNVLIAAMERGQLLGIGLLFCVLLIIARLPADELSLFVRTILNGFAGYYYIGYAVAGAAVIGWRAHVQRLIKKHELEEKRIAEERNILQQRALPGLLASSNDGEENE